jgi:alpha-L-fucosidase
MLWLSDKLPYSRSTWSRSSKTWFRDTSYPPTRIMSNYSYNCLARLEDYHTSRRDLPIMPVEIVSRGGNQLPEIGPKKSDGSIPVIMQEGLTQICD